MCAGAGASKSLYCFGRPTLGSLAGSSWCPRVDSPTALCELLRLKAVGTERGRDLYLTGKRAAKFSCFFALVSWNLGLECCCGVCFSERCMLAFCHPRFVGTKGGGLCLHRASWVLPFNPTLITWLLVDPMSGSYEFWLPRRAALSVCHSWWGLE